MPDRTSYNRPAIPDQPLSNRSEQSRREIALAMAAVWRERYRVADTVEQGAVALASAERWEREAWLSLPTTPKGEEPKGEDNAE